MGRSEWDERAPKEQTDHVNRKLETYLKIYTVVKIRTQIGAWHSVAQEIGNWILKPCTSLSVWAWLEEDKGDDSHNVVYCRESLKKVLAERNQPFPAIHNVLCAVFLY